jgi:hypothetical protein
MVILLDYFLVGMRAQMGRRPVGLGFNPAVGASAGAHFAAAFC